MNQIRFSKDGKLFFRTVSSGGVEVRDLPLTLSSVMRNFQEPLSLKCNSTLKCKSTLNQRLAAAKVMLILLDLVLLVDNLTAIMLVAR